jgi:hypothetical protein
MDKTESTMAQELAAAARSFQLQQTGRAPKNVTVIISEDTLVVTPLLPRVTPQWHKTGSY